MGFIAAKRKTEMWMLQQYSSVQYSSVQFVPPATDVGFMQVYGFKHKHISEVETAYVPNLISSQWLGGVMQHNAAFYSSYTMALANTDRFYLLQNDTSFCL